MAPKKPYHECPDFEEQTGNRCPLEQNADRESQGSNLKPEGREVFECWAKERQRAGVGVTRFRQKELDKIRGTLFPMRRISRSKGPNDGRYSNWFG